MELGEESAFVARLDERLNALIDSFEAYRRTSDRALLVADAEFHRRLDELNGEAERLKNMQATYLPREIYERNRETVEARMGSIERFNANLTGKQWIAGAVILVLAAALAFFVPMVERSVK